MYMDISYNLYDISRICRIRRISRKCTCRNLNCYIYRIIDDIKALDDNHEVVALVRSPEKIEIKHEKLILLSFPNYALKIAFSRLERISESQ